MVFSSSVFLFFFLPIVLCFYFSPLNKKPKRFIASVLLLAAALFLILVPFRIPVRILFWLTLMTGSLYFILCPAQESSTAAERNIRNLILLAASMLFYAYGEPVYVVLLAASILVNWAFGLWLGRRSNTVLQKKWIVALDLIYNIGVFFVFKYLNFTIGNLNSLLGLHIPLTRFLLPIGISFYTFQAISYVIDIYREEVPAEKDPLKVGLYIAMFPQLIAGPIVRYNTISQELTTRRETRSDFAAGVFRFTAGLGKKILLANPCAYLADTAFGSGNDLTVLMAWAGAAAYSFQIYFDFSGYSDMAIGLGKMFGFHFMENFNFPYIANSITDFWRRWHISLSTWFRDYVYIPLGGSRVNSFARMVFNLLVVWLLTGFWHGANWTFLCWGLFYFVLLLAERITGINKKSSLWGCIYTLPMVIFGWVLFRSPDISGAWFYLKTMFGLAGSGWYSPGDLFNISEYLPYLLASLVFCLPGFKFLLEHRFFRRSLFKRVPVKILCRTLNTAVFLFILFVFLLSVSYIIKSTNNPFIYFNF